MGDVGVSDMIRRFREGKPMSSEERSQTRGKMWWETDGSPSPATSLKKEELMMFKQPLSYMDEPIGRVHSSGSKGRAAWGDTDEPSPPRSRAPVPSNLDRSFDVDNMIEQEIRLLERDLHSRERDTAHRLNLGNYGGNHTLNRSAEYGNGGAGRLGGSLSMEFAGFARPAGEAGPAEGTLGSTGLLGLMKDDLRLDGALPAEEKKSDAQANMNNVNMDLEELLKQLQANAPPPHPSYLPEGVEETIPQIINKLDQDLSHFRSLYDGMVAADERAEKERWMRDEAMREEGRAQERERRLLDGLGQLPVFEPRAAPAQLRLHEFNVRREVLPSMDALRHAVSNGVLTFEEATQRVQDLRLQSASSARMRVIEGVYNGTMDPNRVIRRDGQVDAQYLGDIFGEQAELRDLAFEDLDAPRPEPVNWNPHPNLVHKSIVTTSQAIASSLGVAMDVLNQRLPEKTTATPLSSLLAARRVGSAPTPATASTITSSAAAAVSAVTAPSPALGSSGATGASPVGALSAPPAAGTEPPAPAPGTPRLAGIKSIGFASPGRPLVSGVSEEKPSAPEAGTAIVSKSVDFSDPGPTDSPSRASSSKFAMLMKSRQAGAGGAAAGSGAPAASAGTSSPVAAPAPAAPAATATPSTVKPSVPVIPVPASSGVSAKTTAAPAASAPGAAASSPRPLDSERRNVFVNLNDEPDAIRLPSVLAGYRRRGYISSLGFKTDLEFVDAVLGGTDAVDKQSLANLGNSSMRKDHFSQFLPGPSPADSAALGFASSSARMLSSKSPRPSPAPREREREAVGPREALHGVRREPAVYAQASQLHFPHDLPFHGPAGSRPHPSDAPSAPPLDYETAMRVATSNITRAPVQGSAMRRIRSPVGHRRDYSEPPVAQHYGELDSGALHRDTAEKKDQLRQLRALRAQMYV